MKIILLRDFRPTPSWPGLTRPSTSCRSDREKDVDARVKPGHDDLDAPSPQPHVAIGVGMVRNARVTCQNNCRLVASTTECAVPGRMANWRSPFGSLL